MAKMSARTVVCLLVVLLASLHALPLLLFLPISTIAILDILGFDSEARALFDYFRSLEDGLPDNHPIEIALALVFLSYPFALIGQEVASHWMKRRHAADQAPQFRSIMRNWAVPYYVLVASCAAKVALYTFVGPLGSIDFLDAIFFTAWPLLGLILSAKRIRVALRVRREHRSTLAAFP